MTPEPLMPSVPLPIGSVPDRDVPVELEAPRRGCRRVGVGEAAVDGDEVAVTQEVGADVGPDLERRRTEAQPERDVVEIHALGDRGPPAEVAEDPPSLEIRPFARPPNAPSCSPLGSSMSALASQRFVVGSVAHWMNGWSPRAARARRVAAERRRVARGRRQTAGRYVGEADAVDLQLAEPDVLRLEPEAVVVDPRVIDAQRRGPGDTAEGGVRTGGERGREARCSAGSRRSTSPFVSSPSSSAIEPRTCSPEQHGTAGDREGKWKHLLVTRPTVRQRPVDIAREGGEVIELHRRVRGGEVPARLAGASAR